MPLCDSEQQIYQQQIKSEINSSNSRCLLDFYLHLLDNNCHLLHSLLFGDDWDNCLLNLGVYCHLLHLSWQTLLLFNHLSFYFCYCWLQDFRLLLGLQAFLLLLVCLLLLLVAPVRLGSKDEACESQTAGQHTAHFLQRTNWLSCRSESSNKSL